MPSFIGGLRAGSIVKTDGAANARHIPDREITHPDAAYLYRVRHLGSDSSRGVTRSTNPADPRRTDPYDVPSADTRGMEGAGRTQDVAPGRWFTAVLVAHAVVLRKFGNDLRASGARDNCNAGRCRCAHRDAIMEHRTRTCHDGARATIKLEPAPAAGGWPTVRPARAARPARSSSPRHRKARRTARRSAALRRSSAAAPTWPAGRSC